MASAFGGVVGSMGTGKICSKSVTMSGVYDNFGFIAGESTAALIGIDGQVQSTRTILGVSTPTGGVGSITCTTNYYFCTNNPDKCGCNE